MSEKPFPKRIQVAPKTSDVAPEKPVFVYDDHLYFLKNPPTNVEYLNKLTPYLEGDELVEEGVYTWVMVAKGVRSPPSSQTGSSSSSSSSSSSTSKNTTQRKKREKFVLYYKRAHTTSEIRSKHVDILSDVFNNDTSPLNAEIDTLLFAGEFIFRLDDDEEVLRPRAASLPVITGRVRYNFLSGSYMMGVVDVVKPTKKEETFVGGCMRRILGSRIVSIECDKSGKTLMTNENIPMTSTVLHDLLHAGAVIYRRPLSVRDELTDKSISQIKNILTNLLLNKARLGGMIEAAKNQMAASQKVADRAYRDRVLKKRDASDHVHEDRDLKAAYDSAIATFHRTVDDLTQRYPDVDRVLVGKYHFAKMSKHTFDYVRQSALRSAAASSASSSASSTASSASSSASSTASSSSASKKKSRKKKQRSPTP